MPALGAGDSGFESLHSDMKRWYTKAMKVKRHHSFLIIVGLAIITILVALLIVFLRSNKRSDFRDMENVAMRKQTVESL